MNYEYIYIYIYSIHFDLKFFDSHIESWLEWDSNP